MVPRRPRKRAQGSTNSMGLYQCCVPPLVQTGSQVIASAAAATAKKSMNHALLRSCMARGPPWHTHQTVFLWVPSLEEIMNPEVNGCLATSQQGVPPLHSPVVPTCSIPGAVFFVTLGESGVVTTIYVWIIQGNNKGDGYKVSR